MSKYFDGEILSAYEDLNKEFEYKKENTKLQQQIIELKEQLKSQPKEIVEKINGEIYTRMVVECKETKYTDINLILNTILKEYEN